MNTPYSMLKTFNISNLRLLKLLVSNHQTIINNLDLVVKNVFHRHHEKIKLIHSSCIMFVELYIYKCVQN